MDVVKITIESNAEDAAKTFEKLANSFDDSNKQATDLRKQIKGLKDDLYKLTPGTEEYAKVLGQLGDKMNTLGDITREVKAASGGLDTVFETTTTAVSSLTSGFQAAVGVCTLFGTESEDLMKTLVKLQAIMSIVNGLKGFAAFPKNVRTAAISIGAFSTAVKATTGTVTENTVAIRLNSAELEKNSVKSLEAGESKTLLGNAFSKVTTAIGSMNVAMVAVTAAIGIFVAALASMYKHSKEVREQMEENDRLINELSESSLSYAEVNKKLDADLQRRIKAYAKLGASEESLIKIQREYYTEQLRSANAARDAAIQQARFYETSTSFKDKLEEAQKTIKETTDRIKELESSLSSLVDNSDITGWASKMVTEFTNFDREIERSLNRGEITEGNALKRRIKRRKDTLEELEQIEQLYYHGTFEQMDEAQKRARKLGLYNLQDTGQIEAFRSRTQQEIEDLGESLEDWQDKSSKAYVETAKKSLEKLGEEEEKVSDKFEEFTKSYEAQQKTFESLVSGTDFTDADANARIYKWNEAQAKAVDEYVKNQIKLASKMNLTKSDMQKYIDFVTKKAEEYKSMMEDSQFPYAPAMDENVKKTRDELAGMMDTFKTVNAGMKKLVDENVITQEDYQSWLVNYAATFTQEAAKKIEEGSKAIEKALAENPVFKDLPEDKKEEIRQFWTKLLDFTGDLTLDTSTVTSISNAIDDTLKKAFEQAEKTAEEELAKYDTEHQHEPNLIDKLFGTENTAGFQERFRERLKFMMEQARQTYESEASSIQEEMSKLEAMGLKGSEEYQKLVERLKAIKQTYDDYIKESTDKLDESLEAEVKAITDKASAIAGALGSWSSFMSDYYDDMAENEAKNEKEKRKYTIKGLKMQKLTAVANIASGIAGAIANAFATFPMPAAAILAAVESAAVAAAGALQIKQINRQIKEAGGSSGGNDTPDAAGMVDRIIVGDTQNSDQKDQLNAQYNAEAMGETKVYVTQNDITDAQDVNRTAVTQNTF